MIIRDANMLEGTDRHVIGKTNREWSSRRFLLRQDGFPFSVNLTKLEAGCRMEIAYKHHWEACLCTSGKGTVYSLSDNSVQSVLTPGVLYALEKGERHVLEAETDLELVSIFSPPLYGPEVHDPEGSYPEHVRNV